MANTDTSLRDKERFFHQLEAIDKLSDDDDDEFGEAEKQHRQQFKAFQAAAQPLLPLQERRPESLPSPVISQHRQNPTPKRTVSDPILAPLTELRPEDVIERTPLAEIKGLGRKDRDVAPPADTSFIEDTPIPDSSSRQPLQPLSTLTRTSSTPLPAKKHPLSHVVDHSPSVTAMKKRKRDQPVKLVHEAQQVLLGMRLYYIPNDDINPARRMRIRRSLEFGAAWVRNLEEATHVIVDRNLEWKHIEKIIHSVECSPAFLILDEQYPLDCCRFRTLLNPHQNQYKVTGCPGQSPGAVTEPQHAQPPTPVLQERPLKKRQTNPGKWDYVPPPSTPSRSQESSSRRSDPPPPLHSPPVVKDITETTQPEKTHSSFLQVVDESDQEDYTGSSERPPSTVDDELEGVISQLQQFRDLPLEHDDDDEEPPMSSGSVHVESDEDNRTEDESQRRTRAATKARGRKDLTWEDKFACHRGGTRGGDNNNPNSRTIEILQKMCDYYTRTNDTWRPIAYRKAITQLKRQHTKISTAEEAIRLPGVGQRLADKIQEIVTTDRLKRLEHAESEPMDEVLQTFLKIYGVGSVQASQWISQGFRTLDDLKQRAKLTTNQRIGIDHFDHLNTRIPRAEVKLLGAFVKAAAKDLDPDVELIISGSYRRGANDSGDVDFLVTKKGTKATSELVPFLNALVKNLEKQKFLVARLASSRDETDGSKWHGCCALPMFKGFNDENYRKIWRRIDFLLVPQTEIGAALIYFTGNDIFNRSIRLLASKKGMRLNQRGLYKDVMRGPGRVKLTEGELVEGRDERKIFEILGVKWREPNERWC